MANWAKAEELYKGKRVLVLGAARSGISAAHLLLRLSAEIVLNDLKATREGEWVKELEEAGAKVILGSHPDDLLTKGFDLLVKNPGIPYSHPYVEEALKIGIPVITEIELGFALHEGTCIGITGSNGKTTTTSLVGEMFTRSNLKTLLAGNIGTVFCEQVQKSNQETVMVTELSSFQLKGTHTFKPHIACLLNIFHHHLDYHQTMDDYISSKYRIFANQTTDDFAILNWDQEMVRDLRKRVKGRVYGFSRLQTLEQGAYLMEYEEDGTAQTWIVFSHPGEEPFKILPAVEARLRGSHNLENILASVTIAMIGGITPEVIAEVLRTFKGVEHRLEYVAEKSGVHYYNDSKATNPEATEKALVSFTDPVILIAGGLDRGDTFAELLPFFSTRVKAIIIYGETKEKLSQIAKGAGVKEVQIVDNVTEAVEQAAHISRPGDVVLLSPACASWDMYTSFEERGRIFKEAVHSLK